jgi:hypothetical protein
MKATNSFRVLYLGLFVLSIIFAGGCGGGFNANNVTVSLSPSTVTVPANGQVRLKATEHGDCSGCGPIYFWSITENDGTNCTWVDLPPVGPCPAGTIQASVLNGPNVTYFAPNTAGTFHVVLTDIITLQLTTDASSIITVSP